MILPPLPTPITVQPVTLNAPGALPIYAVGLAIALIVLASYLHEWRHPEVWR